MDKKLSSRNNLMDRGRDCLACSWLLDNRLGNVEEKKNLDVISVGVAFDT